MKLLFLKHPSEVQFFRRVVLAGLVVDPLGFVLGAVFLWRLRPRQAVDLLR